MTGFSEATGAPGEDSLATWSDASDAPEADDGGGEVSQGPSGQISSVESAGGADAVPETPDNVPADQDLDIRDSDAGAPLTENGHGGPSTSDA